MMVTYGLQHQRPVVEKGLVVPCVHVQDQTDEEYRVPSLSCLHNCFYGYLCLRVSLDSWQLPGQVHPVFLAAFSEVVCPAVSNWPQTAYRLLGLFLLELK